MNKSLLISSSIIGGFIGGFLAQRFWRQIDRKIEDVVFSCALLVFSHPKTTIAIIIGVLGVMLGIFLLFRHSRR